MCPPFVCPLFGHIWISYGVSKWWSPIKIDKASLTRNMVLLTSAPGRIRTCDLMLRRHMLYPLSYGHKIIEDIDKKYHNDFSADNIVLSTNIAMVIGPTPPGAGDIADTLFTKELKSASPTIL